jgi:hypothetical protein
MVQIHYWFQDEIQWSFNRRSGTGFETVSGTGFRAVSASVSDTDSITGFITGF